MLIQLACLLYFLWYLQRLGHVAIAKGLSAWKYRLIAIPVVVGGWLVGLVLAIFATAYLVIRQGGGEAGLPAYVIATILPLAGFVVCAVIYWRFVNGLTPTADAPGDRYLKISFLCEHCGQRISFRRDQAGLMESCPECNRKVIIPEESTVPELTENGEEQA